MDAKISKSLVADYDSSSEDVPLSETTDSENHADRLASAVDMLDQTIKGKSHSVFTNPYKEIENYEQAMLEKHVKMTTVKEDEIQAKPCYKFNRGKCKQGDKCCFSHHNPIHIPSTETDGDIYEESPKIKSKKRCGLKDDLIPPKKFIKSYNKCK